jgi:predicted secreted protein
MNKPILGKDVIIQFDRGSDFGTYYCASNLEISFQMTTKETKTVGDGTWKRKRGQSKSATISLDGVAVLSDLFTTSFTLLDYFNNMTDIPFRIIFTDEQSDTRVIEGVVLPTDINLSGGSEGHANGSMTLEVNGPVDIRDDVVPCGYSISSVVYDGEVDPDFNNFHINMTPGSGLITRFDYSLDGGGIQTLFTPVGALKDVSIVVPGAMGSSHQLSIFPICDNGYSGPEYILNFTKHI